MLDVSAEAKAGISKVEEINFNLNQVVPGKGNLYDKLFESGKSG
jgi:hypothetical protein